MAYIATRTAPPSTPRNAPTPKPPRPSPPTDPFAPYSQAQINAQAQQAANRYGMPQTPAQVQTTAQGMLDPVIAAITKNIQDQTAQAGQQISGNSSSLAKALAGIDYGAPYTGGESKQAAVDAALQQSLTGGGQQMSQDLSARLAGIGGPAVGDTAAGLASRGAAIGTNAQAVGSAALSNLIADETAARAYGQQLPGIAQRQGLQDIAGVEAAGVKNIGDQTAQVMTQLPQIVENLRAQGLSLQQARAAAYQHVQDVLGGQNISKSTIAAGLGYKSSELGIQKYKAQTAAQQGATRNAIAQQNADANSLRAAVAKYKALNPNTTSKASQPSASITKQINDGYLHLANGQRAMVNGKPVPVAKNTTSQAGGVTAQKQTAEAWGSARHYHQTWQDKNKVWHPPLRWSAWITAGLQQGISLKTLQQQGRKVYTPDEIKNDSQPPWTPGVGGH